jgi:hypothetical protein
MLWQRSQALCGMSAGDRGSLVHRSHVGDERGEVGFPPSEHLSGGLQLPFRA